MSRPIPIESKNNIIFSIYFCYYHDQLQVSIFSFSLFTVMVQEFKKNHTNSHLFKIDNFSLLTKYEIDCIESSVFDLCGRKWYRALFLTSFNIQTLIKLYIINKLDHFYLFIFPVKLTIIFLIHVFV